MGSAQAPPNACVPIGCRLRKEWPTQPWCYVEIGLQSLLLVLVILRTDCHTVGVTHISNDRSSPASSDVGLRRRDANVPRQKVKFGLFESPRIDGEADQ
jgi:hypothetical protein